MPRRLDEVKANRLDRSVGKLKTLTLRSLPFIAPHAFSPARLLEIVGNPDGFVQEIEVVLQTYTLLHIDRLVPCPSSTFDGYRHDVEVLPASAPKQAHLDCIPEGRLVKYEEAKTFQHRYWMYLSKMGWDDPEDGVWLDEPALTTAEWTYVFAGFPKAFVQQMAPYRANSQVLTLDTLDRYVKAFFARAAIAGVDLDRQAMPPTMERFIAALRRLEGVEPALPYLATHTSRPYLKKLGIRFTAGRPKSEFDDPYIRVVPEN